MIFFQFCPLACTGQSFDLEMTSLFMVETISTTDLENVKKIIFSLDEVENELRRRGLTPEEFGTHYLRKGAASLCASGHTNAPPVAFIYIRDGQWALFKTSTFALRLLEISTWGRTVSGLPISSYNFSTLPSRFKFADDQVERTKQLMFSSAPK
eukprot:maker-scaffold_8-snap-gene-13.56-mRNA-1 protein AED:0.36 eAED:0.37 QI:0/0/0/1/0/0/2/0/153